MSPLPTDHPLVVAHQGASAFAPGNTLAAFALAVAQDADAVELDLRRSGDGALVVHHDPVLDDGAPIVDLDLAAIRERRPDLPTLDQVMDVTGDLLVNIEIKNDPTEPGFDEGRTLGAGIAAWLRDRGLERRVVVTSFDPLTVEAVRRSDPDGEVATGQLTGRVGDLGAMIGAVAGAGHRWVVPHHGALDDDPEPLIELAHAEGLRMMVWTLDDPGRMRRLAAAGIDAIITNDPAMANATLA